MGVAWAMTDTHVPQQCPQEQGEAQLGASQMHKWDAFVPRSSWACHLCRQLHPLISLDAQPFAKHHTVTVANWIDCKTRPIFTRNTPHSTFLFTSFLGVSNVLFINILLLRPDSSFRYQCKHSFLRKPSLTR